MPNVRRSNRRARSGVVSAQHLGSAETFALKAATLSSGDNDDWMLGPPRWTRVLAESGNRFTAARCNSLSGADRRLGGTIAIGCWHVLLDGERSPPVNYDEQRGVREHGIVLLEVVGQNAVLWNAPVFCIRRYERFG